jgi:RNA polymerase sigma-70 factor, ECF subfamily
MKNGGRKDDAQIDWTSIWRMGEQMTLRGDCRTLMVISLSRDNDAGKLGGAASSGRSAAREITEIPDSFLNEAKYTAPLSDQDLVVAAQSGCRTAFTELWNLYSRRIYGTIFKIVKNPQDAEDALQDSFLRAFLALDSFEGRASFYTWLSRIAINSALGILRKRRCRPESSMDSTSRQNAERASEDFRDLAPDPEHVFDQQQRRDKLMQAIGKLPTNLRETVQELLAEDCSVKEVADRLNISQAAAKSRLYRARIRLSSLAAARYRPRTQTAVSGPSETFPG